MYKTVRQGENSLQYTILPQTEEVLCNSGVKGKGRDYSPSIHVRRTRKRSTLRCVLLIILGASVTFAVALVPFAVMDAMALVAERDQAKPTLRAVPILTYKGVTYDLIDVAASRKDEALMKELYPERFETPAKATSSASPPAPATATASTTSAGRSMPTFKPFETSGSEAPSSSAPSPPPPPGPAVEDADELNLPNGLFGRVHASSDRTMTSWGDRDVIIRPTATPEPKTVAKDVFSYVTRMQAGLTTGKPTPPEPSTFEDVLITTRASSALEQTPEDRFDKTYPLGKDLKDVKESILGDEDDFKDAVMDEVFSSPPLRREPGGGGGDGGGGGGRSGGKGKPSWIDVGDDDIKVTKASPTKLRNLWGFNPTSIFQWPDYSQEDSMVVPLLALTVTLLTVALGLTVAVAIRRHRQHDTGTHIGKLTADLQADDNTNLLTAESNEEE